MTIAEGDTLPEATFRIMSPNGIDTLSTKDVFGGKKVLLKYLAMLNHWLVEQEKIN